MTDPINLRQVRKAKKRAQHEAVGAQNRVTFGQTKSAKSIAQATTTLAQRNLDGHRLEKADKS